MNTVHKKKCNRMYIQFRCILHIKVKNINKKVKHCKEVDVK